MTLKRCSAPEVSRAATADGRPRVIISTDRVDSERDIIEQQGLRFRERLPVMLNHDYRELPVGQVTRILREAGRTSAEWRWFEGDERAARVKSAYEQDLLSASVGLRVDAAEPNDVGGVRITSGEVIEFSLTAVPANSDCIPLLRSLFAGAGPTGAPRDRDEGDEGDDMVLTLHDDDTPGLLRFEPRDLAEAVRAHVADAVRTGLRQRDREHVLVDLADVRGAIATVLGGEVTRHLRRLMGRVD